ncbi:hypothetical protein OAQ34_09520 [Opitutales bacterium]|nr:hypothetical protein [Opitutales bacterium]
MEVVLFVLLGLLVLVVAFRVNRSSTVDDLNAIEKEIDKDFEEGFEHESVGELSTHGMSDLVDWYEDDLRERKLEQSKEIESFNEIK